MIHFSDKRDCCGCSACVQRCPRQCMTMESDDEGFLYPQIDTSNCIDCGLCEKVCPIQNAPRLVDSLGSRAYAAIGKNEGIRLVSSSGGIFTVLATQVIREGGVVFGVRFDERWEAVFDCVDKVEGLSSFRGSKYMQARVGNAFRDAEQMLKKGRKVMFVGTGCQIKALRLFLRKDYPSLFAVDFICHGVPSPAVWNHYLRNLLLREARKNTVSSPSNPFLSERDVLSIKGISFRNKCLGWKKYSFVLQTSQGDSRSEENSVSSSYKFHETAFSQPFSENPFMKAFLENAILRPSCYECKAKGGKSGSDMTIADFWGIERILPRFDDDKGTSLVIVHTRRGECMLEAVRENLCMEEVTMKQATECNPSYYVSVKAHKKRKEFFANYRQQADFQEYVNRLFPQVSFKGKMLIAIKRMFVLIGNKIS